MNMPFLTMQALLGTDKRPPELPADDSKPGRLMQAIAAARDGSENAEALKLLRAAGVQAVCGLAGYQPPAPTPPSPSPARRNPARPSTRPPSSTYCAKSFPADPTVCALKPSGHARRGESAPSALLPQALELGRRTPSLRGPIALIAGERGRWLGGRNAAWNLFCHQRRKRA